LYSHIFFGNVVIFICIHQMTKMLNSSFILFPHELTDITNKRHTTKDGLDIFYAPGLLQGEQLNRYYKPPPFSHIKEAQEKYPMNFARPVEYNVNMKRKRDIYLEKKRISHHVARCLLRRNNTHRKMTKNRNHTPSGKIYKSSHLKKTRKARKESAKNAQKERKKWKKIIFGSSADESDDIEQLQSPEDKSSKIDTSPSLENVHIICTNCEDIGCVDCAWFAHMSSKLGLDMNICTDWFLNNGDGNVH